MLIYVIISSNATTAINPKETNYELSSEKCFVNNHRFDYYHTIHFISLSLSDICFSQS